MSKNIPTVMPIEKIISVLSYISMGLVGFVWLIIAVSLHKKLRYFLLYNIIQSVIISLFLAVLGSVVQFLFAIMAKISFLDFFVAIINLILNFKVIKIYQLGMYFSIFELFVCLVIGYIILGILAGRIFYVPFLSPLMIKVMQYNKL